MTELFISLIVFLFIADIAVYYFFIKRKVNLLNKEREEFQQEEEESINEFVQKYKELDEELAQRVEEIQALNTVVFDCPCNHNTIAVPIDLSKEENTFVCPECKNEYRVNINMFPVLKGKIVDEHNMYDLLSEKYKTTKKFNSDEK